MKVVISSEEYDDGTYLAVYADGTYDITDASGVITDTGYGDPRAMTH